MWSHAVSGHRFLAWWPVLAGALTIGLLLRAIALGRDELWFDEAFAALVAFESPRRIVEELTRDSSPPLYYVLLHLWQQAVGADPIQLRAVSVVCGVLAIYLAASLGRTVFDARTGMLTAVLLMLSPLHIYYSREARAYSLLIVFVLWSLLNLAKLSRGDRSPMRVALLCLATVCAVYTHNYGLLLLPVLALWIIRGWVPLRAGIGSAAIILLAYAPWVPVLINQVRTGTAGWVASIWDSTPPALALVRSFAAFCIAGAVPDYVLLEGPWSIEPVHWMAYATFAVLAFRSLNRMPGHRGSAQTLLTIGILLGLPFLASFITPVYVVARYDVVALPLFMMMIAHGTTGLEPRRFLPIVGSILMLAAIAIGSYYKRVPIQDSSLKASWLSQHARPQDVVLCTGFTRNSLEYYVRKHGGRQAFYSYPTSFGVHRGWVDDRELADHAFLLRDANGLVEQMATTLQPGARLWIAHTRLLREANDILMARVERRLRQTPCPDDGESKGFTCWQRSNWSPMVEDPASTFNGH